MKNGRCATCAGAALPTPPNSPISGWMALARSLLGEAGMGRFLIISRDEELRRRLALSLRAQSHLVDESSMPALVASPPERVVVDTGRVLAPAHDVASTLRDLVGAWPGVPVVVMAPSPSAYLMHVTLRLGAVHCIARSAEADVVLRAFAEAEQPTETLAGARLFATLDEARWEHLGRALEAAKGNISVAARLLGLHRQSLQRMLRALRRDEPAARVQAA